MDATRCHIIVVLGAQNDLDGRLSPMARARAMLAIDQFRQTPKARVLLTASYGHFNQSSRPHAYHMARFMIDRGVNADALLPFVLSTNTVEDAALSARLLCQYAVSSMCVVTSQVHVERSRLIFEHFFDRDLLSFVGAPNGVSDGDLPGLLAHEAAGIQQIRSQGGVWFEGRLHRHLRPHLGQSRYCPPPTVRDPAP
jgi:uncharacterized SAM-binding protein YcdF (DUF218 family)